MQDAIARRNARAAAYRKERELHRIAVPRVRPEELGAYRADPLQEEKTGAADFIACRLCGAKLGKLPQHLTAEHAAELAQAAEAEDAAQYRRRVVLAYRLRFGYNRNAPLAAAAVRRRLQASAKQRSARRKVQGRPVAGSRTRFTKTRIQRERLGERARAGRKEWGTAPEARQRLSQARRGRAFPGRQATGADDWRIAKLRLAGQESGQIAAKCGITPGAVVGRLRRLGFPPGKPCRFFCGEPVTEKHLLAHHSDLVEIRTLRPVRFRLAKVPGGPIGVGGVAKLLGVKESWVREHTRQRDKNPIPHIRKPRPTGTGRGGDHLEFQAAEVLRWAEQRHHGKMRTLSTWPVEQEMAQRLGVGEHRVYEFAVHPGGPPNSRDGRQTRKAGHPLSCKLADRLLASQASLRDEWRKLGAGPRGGRPKAMLPSEEAQLPDAYKQLRAALDAMLRWAREQEGQIKAGALGLWLCGQSRLGRCRCLLFRANSPVLLEACNRAAKNVDGPVGAAGEAAGVLAVEWGLSGRALAEAVKNGRTLT